MKFLKKIPISLLVLAGLGAYAFLTMPDSNLGAKKYGTWNDTGQKLELELPEVANGGKNKIKVDKNKSEVILGRWNDEVSLSIDFGILGNASHSGSTNEITFTNPTLDVVVYALSPDEQNDSGGLEYEVVLKQLPPTNEIVFQLQGYENFDFFYQPELTQQEIDGGNSRPDNVIGSYAVYHKAKRDYILGNTNYATGKAFHIYRPKLIDDNGVESWATMSFNDSNGELTITADQAFLDNAAYPVIVDPTFGYTTEGGSVATYSHGTTADLAGSRQTSTQSGTVDSITIYIRQSVSSLTEPAFKGIILDNVTPSILTNGVGAGVAVPSTTFSWLTSSFSTSPSVSASTVYILAFVNGDANGDIVQVAYDTGTTNQSLEEGDNDYTTPADPVGYAEFDIEFSIYATYTEVPAFTVNVDSGTLQLNSGTVEIR